MTLTTIRPAPNQLRAVFPLALPDRVAQLPAKPGHRHPTVLNIGLSATALFDHGYTGPRDLTAFQDFMYKNRHNPMPVRPQASAALSLLDLNYLTEAQDPLVVLHIMTLLEDNANERIITSLKANGFLDHDFNNDFVPTSKFHARGGEEASWRELGRKAKNLGIDFFFAGTTELAELLNYDCGVASGVMLANPDVGLYDPAQTRLFLTDGDGCAYSDFYEKKFQEIFEQVNKDINEAKRLYYNFVFQDGADHMLPGPTLALFRGLSLLAGLFEVQEGQLPPLRLGLVTTRDFRGSIAYREYFRAQGVNFDSFDCVSGNIKNPYLAGAIAMFEDGLGHLERTLKMPPDTRPTCLVYIPFGVKHSRLKEGKTIIADGRGTVGDKSGEASGLVVDVGSLRGA